MNKDKETWDVFTSYSRAASDAARSAAGGPASAPPAARSAAGLPVSAAPGAEVGGRGGRSPAGEGLSWLHLSDLHLEGGDTYDSDVVLEALVDLIRSERPQRAPDFIVATGDIAYSGRAEEYGKATAFFSDLLDAAGLADQRERLVVVPGNHDVDRRVLRGLARTLRDESDSQDYFSAEHPRHHFVGQASYRAWHDDFFAGVGRRAPTDTTCGPLVRLELGSATVAILPINTALFARDEHDHNKLWVGRRALRGPVRALRDDDAALRVVAMHHPVEWLCDAERAQVRGALRGPADLILTGHLHEADAARVITSSAEALHVAAGAAYQDSAYPRRLFYGRLDRQAIRLRPYCYADNIERWVVDASVFPGARDFEGVFPRPPR